MNGNNIGELLEAVAGYTRGLREGAALARSSQRHADNMVLWIISLSSGAVIALPATLSFFLSLKTLPGWVLGLLLGPFVLAVLVGIAFRLFLAKLMSADDKYSFAMIHALEALKLRGFEGQDGLEQLRQEVLAIVERRDADIARLKADVDRLDRSWGWLAYWPYIFFAVGVVGAATSAVGAPSGTSVTAGRGQWCLLIGLLLGLAGTLAVAWAQRPAANGVHGTIVFLQNRWLLHTGLIVLASGFAMQIVALWIP